MHIKYREGLWEGEIQFIIKDPSNTKNPFFEKNHDKISQE